MQRPSPLLDALAACLLQGLVRTADLATLTETSPPLVLTVGRSRAIRVGVFTWATDRDAFITALLGGSVSHGPRHAVTGPRVQLQSRADLQVLEEAWGVGARSAAEFYRLGRKEAARSAGRLAQVVARGTGADDPAIGALVARVIERDPVGFAASPWGRMLVGAVRAAPRWRTPTMLHQFALTFDLGLVGPMGLAVWIPGAIELLPHRRPMAAHLRFLFDTQVAPQQRFTGPRARRAALILWWRRAWPILWDGERPTVRQVALGLRRHFPDDYEDEPEPVTLRRLYRRSALLGRASSLTRTAPTARRAS